VENVVGPRNALSTDLVSGGRTRRTASPCATAGRTRSSCRRPAGDAVAVHQHRAADAIGYVAANVPPIMPPHELPTKCVRSIPSPSSYVHDGARAIIETECGGELLALAMAGRVNKDDAATVAEVVGLGSPHVSGHQEARPEHHASPSPRVLHPYPPQRGVDHVSFHRFER
jgi:hypothetical protein